MAKTILIADDEQNIARLVKMSLERNGYSVLTASDGREALALVTEKLPDLVVLDVMMPYIDGFEVLARLKADEATRDIPVVMMTVRARDADEIEACERGAEVYLNKPVNPAELLSHIESILAKAPAE